MQPQITFDLPPLPDTPPQYDVPPQAAQRPVAMRPGDEKLFVVFYQRTVLDGIATKEHGRPIYHDVDFVRIHVPGDKFTVIDKKVGDEERARFPTQWARYSATRTNSMPDGMPLTEWTGVTRSQAEEMRHFNIHTVEQLSTLPDQFGQRFPGFFELRRKAQAYLAAAKDDAFATKIAVENDELKAKIAAQQEQLEKMAKAIESITATKAANKEPNADEPALGRSGRK